jgi:hypothetical protein
VECWISMADPWWWPAARRGPLSTSWVEAAR